MTEKILVIGGSGFVSGTLAGLARDLGYAVWIVTRGLKALPEGVVSLRVDRHDRVGFKDAISGAGVRWDLVVDCVGYDVGDMRQNIDVFPALAKHLVFISTDFVFDPDQRRYPQPADNPGTLTDDSYGGRKRHCELELCRADTGAMRWTILRPCHIYGPGSELGCLPAVSRIPDLLTKIKSGKPLPLVGGGHFLQQPILAADLADLVLSVSGNDSCDRKVYCAGGAEIAESVAYYRMIAEVLGVELQVSELPVARSLQTNPGWRPFLCHRIYDLTPLRLDGLKVPNTPLREGLQRHVEWLEAGRPSHF